MSTNNSNVNAPIEHLADQGGFSLPPTPGEPNNERITFINEPDSPYDIQAPTLVKIGSYLSNLSQQNKYAVDANEKLVLTKFDDSRPSPVSTTNTKAYAPDKSKWPTSVGFPVGNGKTAQDMSNNATLVKSIAVAPASSKYGDSQPLENTEGTPANAYANAVLSYNRFTSSNKLNPTIAAGNYYAQPDSNFNPTVRLQTGGGESLGKYAEPNTYKDENFNHMALIGYMMSLRGTGEVGSGNQGYDPLDGGREAEALLPSGDQLMIERPNVNNFNARRVLSEMTPVRGATKSLVSIYAKGSSDEGDNSWGVMNNIYDQFSGITAIGMVALSIALVLATTALTGILGSVFGLISSNPNATTKHKDGTFVFGKSRANLESAAGFDIFQAVGTGIADLIGIHATTSNFQAALMRGIGVFFGLDVGVSDLLNPTGALGAVATAIESPGFKAVTCRSIMRSTMIFINKLKGLADSPSIMAGVKNFLSLFEILKESKLMSAINLFATLGDMAILKMNEDTLVEKQGGVVYHSTIDAQKQGLPGESVTKHRLQYKAGESSFKIAWANNRTPSSLLLPVNVQGLAALEAATATTQHTSPRAATGQKNDAEWSKSYNYISKENRIPQNVDDNSVSVANIETMLDAEYVPFYFHDLRTNEIISFQAFLGSLKDDYTPQWENSDAFGRVDKVKIYKSTDRRISFDFWVVALDRKDFDDMWVKINKLVTMVYPQYSAGRKLIADGGKTTITMPFSQVMTSSPIVRLRIGDVIRSNYSRFNLSRVFGLADTDAKINGVSLDTSSITSTLQTAKKELDVLLRNPETAGDNYTFYLTSPTPALMAKASSGIQISLPIIGKSSNDRPTQNAMIPLEMLPYFKMRAESSSMMGGQGTFVISAMTPDELKQNWRLNASMIKLVDEQTKVIAEKYKFDSTKFQIPLSSISLTPESMRQFWAAYSESPEEMMKFMDKNSNAIVKSFQEMGGKGLAGTIDQMNFEWLDANHMRWETEQRSRAPQRTKVTMTFSPIHDISPGIDHMGYNRAPIYPVGSMFSEIDR
jgi:hypothetical protein